MAVLKVIAAERIHSAIDCVWSVNEERQFLELLSAREAVHVAVDEAADIVGLQILDRWSPILTSTAHVGEVGTFLLPEWRGQGVGHQLWNTTAAFARHVGYRKLLVQIRGSNVAAQAFYRGLGFQDCGRLSRQVVLDGIEDDEVLFEIFL